MNKVNPHDRIEDAVCLRPRVHPCKRNSLVEPDARPVLRRGLFVGYHTIQNHQPQHNRPRHDNACRLTQLEQGSAEEIEKMLVGLLHVTPCHEYCRGEGQQAVSNRFLQRLVLEGQMRESVEDGNHHLIVDIWGKLAGRLVGQVAQAGEGVEIFPAIGQFRVQGVYKIVYLSLMRLMAAVNHATVCDKAVPYYPLSK